MQQSTSHIRISIAIILLSIFFHQSLLAQANTLIMGKIDSVHLVNKIELQVNQKYLNSKVDVYASAVLEDGTFAFAVEINEPQVATLMYSRNPILIYLEPNDTLYIDANAYSFQYDIEFAGRSGMNNTMLFEYYKENPPEMDALQLAHYRKGKYYFINSPAMDNMMMAMDTSTFKNTMVLREQKALDQLAFFDANYKGMLTDNFKKFLKAEIYYDRAYHTLLYASVYKNVHKVQDTYFDFLDDVDLQNEMIGNYYYRQFLLAYFNYRWMENEAKSDPQKSYYLSLYETAPSILKEKALSFLRSEMITKSFRADEYDDAVQAYINFLETNAYWTFDEKAVTAYEKTVKYHEGSEAPIFELPNRAGTMVKLADHQGKPIYLNFWASWCRPCINKMNTMKPTIAKLEEQGIVFLNVSIDTDKASWEKAIDTNDFGGVHLNAGEGQKSPIAQSYEISALPQYFIINAYGRFSERPKLNNLANIEEILTGLLIK